MLLSKLTAQILIKIFCTEYLFLTDIAVYTIFFKTVIFKKAKFKIIKKVEKNFDF